MLRDGARGPAKLGNSGQMNSIMRKSIELPAVLACTGMLVALGISGCSAAWEQRDGTCVREPDEELVQRVINYSDPELCERAVKERSPNHVRVMAPDD